MAQQVPQLVLQPGSFRVARAQPGAATVRAGGRNVGAEALDLDLRVAGGPLLELLGQPQQGGGVDLLLIGDRHPGELAANGPPQERRRLADEQPAKRFAGLGGARPGRRAEAGEERIGDRCAHAVLAALPPLASTIAAAPAQAAPARKATGAPKRCQTRPNQRLARKVPTPAARWKAPSALPTPVPVPHPLAGVGKLDHQGTFGSFGETVEGGIEGDQKAESDRLRREGETGIGGRIERPAEQDGSSPADAVREPAAGNRGQPFRDMEG